ncbi:hypothetical protein LWI28_016905 [Acer negundo]|uniref:Uncharacterized protein n=1 Tax=Acer negundo TaxID=4023 RepID=A0AAD5IFQ4_ACENE|nr:hypothetical protein LWI28_016905 [Acer negundo]
MVAAALRLEAGYSPMGESPNSVFIEGAGLRDGLVNLKETLTYGGLKKGPSEEVSKVQVGFGDVGEVVEKKSPILVLTNGLMGGYSICVNGELKGLTDSSLYGKKDVIDISESKYCSRELKRNTMMVPIFVNSLGKEVASISSKRSGKKSSLSLMSHSMKTRSSSVHDKIHHQI